MAAYPGAASNACEADITSAEALEEILREAKMETTCTATEQHGTQIFLCDDVPTQQACNAGDMSVCNGASCTMTGQEVVEVCTAWAMAPWSWEAQPIGYWGK